MNVRVDGEETACVPADDRGLLYGDGVFETLRCFDGASPLWERHCTRLETACAALNLAPPARETVRADVAAVCAGLPDAVVRVTLTRGSGPRGYAPPAQARPRRIVAAAATVAWPAPWYARGVALRVCTTRWPAQPRLAGVKHLNRLDQVLARSEWSDPDIAEGLMLDAAGHVISATAANLFATVDGALVTPTLTRCGVIGVAREAVRGLVPQAIECDLPLADLLRAEEVFLTSSVRGVVPVAAIGAQRFAPGPVARSLMRHWQSHYGYTEVQA